MANFTRWLLSGRNGALKTMESRLRRHG